MLTLPAQASISVEKTVVHDRIYNTDVDAVFSGRIFEVTAAGNLSSVTYTYGSNGLYAENINTGERDERTWSIVGTDNGTYTGPSGNAMFWQNVWNWNNSSAMAGQTLKINNGAGQCVLTMDFDYLTLGGLISQGASSGWNNLATNNARNVRFHSATGVPVRLQVTKNLEIRVNNAGQQGTLIFSSNAEWAVWGGYSFNTRRFDTQVWEDKTLSLSRISGDGNALVNILDGGNIFLLQGSTNIGARLEVGSGVRLEIREGELRIDGNDTANVRVTNDGEITLHRLRSNTSDINPRIAGSGSWTFNEGGSIVNRMTLEGNMTFINGAESGLTFGDGTNGAQLSVTDGNTLTWRDNLKFKATGIGITFGGGQFEFTGDVALTHEGNASATVAAGTVLDIRGGLSLDEGFIINGASGDGTGIVRLHGGTLSMAQNSQMDNMFTLALEGVITLEGSGSIMGNVGVTAGENTSVSLATGSDFTISSAASKNFGANGLLVPEETTLTIGNISNWESAVHGEGSVTVDLDNFGSWSAGNLDQASRLFTGDSLATLYVAEGTHLSYVGVDALRSVKRVVVKNGAALNLRSESNAVFGSPNTTLEINGEATLPSAGSALRGALIVGVENGTATGQGAVLSLNTNLELGSSAMVSVAEGRNGLYTLELGSSDAPGELTYTAHGRTLSKVGAGTLRFGSRIHGAEEDSGVIDVRAGSVELAVNAEDAMEHYAVVLATDATLKLANNTDNVSKTYTIASLGGSGQVTTAQGYVLAFKNNDEFSNSSNTFTGTLGDASSPLTVRMVQGYQKLAAEVNGPLNIELENGMLDLNGMNREGAVLHVLVTGRDAMVDGLVLQGNDVLDLNDMDALFNVTMKGGNIENAGSYAGIIFVDDSGAGEAASDFNLNGIGPDVRVVIRSLHVGAESSSSILTDSLTLMLSGNSLITLGKWVEEGQAGFEEGIINLIPERGKIAVEAGASLSLTVVDVLNDIVASGNEGVLFRIANRSIADLQGTLSFGAELALFNISVAFADETGCLRFSLLDVEYDNVYRSTENNDGSAWNTEGHDVYESTDRFVAVYVDKATQIDLTGAVMGLHTDGLVLKNLMSSTEGNLTVVGDGSGKSKITLRNNLSDDELAYLSGEMGVKLENMLTYAGNITLTDADLQVKHAEATSITQMTGCLTMVGDSALEMTRGVLELTSKDNVFGDAGARFTGKEGQLYLHGSTASMGGEILCIEPEEKDVTMRSRQEHVRLSHGAELTLRSDTYVGAGIIIGNTVAHEDDVINGTVIVQGSAQMESGSAMRNVVLNLTSGSHLNVGFVPAEDEEEEGEEVAPVAVAALVAPESLNEAVVWQLAGLTGSGTLSSNVEQDIVISVEKEARTFTGDLSDFHGKMTVAAGEHVQNFVGVQGSKGWFLQNAKGGRVLFNLMGGSGENTLVMGGLSLIGGSETTILMDLAHVGAESGLQLGSLSSQSGAEVLVSHHSGSMRVDESKANALGEVTLCLGRVDDAMDQTLAWSLSGIRNMKENSYRLWVEHAEDGASYLYAAVEVERSNKWGEHTGSGNAGAGSSMLWDVKDSGSVGGDLAALDDVISGLLDGDNWKKPGNVDKANRILAAAAGSSTAVLGQAFAGDMERQLKAIRNRTTGMGYNEMENQYTELPRWNAWVNAEGNYLKQKADGLLPGYKLNGWGGTVGVAVDTSSTVTVGMALTAMYNDLDSEGPDALRSDLDTYYVSAFARVSSGSWLHTFVGSFGLAQVDMNRTVTYGDASYTVDSDTQGRGIGLMYELGYGMVLNNSGTVCLQPVFNVAWRYMSVDSYDENGSTAALSVDSQSYSTLSFGMGARLQAVMGSNIFNHSGLVEARALLKLDMGDRQGESHTAYRYAPEGRATVKSVERGMAGLELGAGVSVPLGAERGDVFFDVSADLRSNATEMNATVGYKLSF